MDFKDTIDAAGKALKQSDLGRLTHIVRAWNDIEWSQVGQVMAQDAAVSERDLNAINIFPGMAQLHGPAQQAALIREFGVSMFRRYADERVKRRWELKLTLPESSQIEEVQSKLKDPQYPTYKAMMESFKRLLDRFVCLNLTNALLANGVKRSDALNLNLRQWGSTLEYANVRKMHSLKPYVTAYGPRDVAECPGRGLAEKIVYEMKHISESSLAEAYGRLVGEVFTLCRA